MTSPFRIAKEPSATLSEALERIVPLVAPLPGCEEIALSAACGRVLARPVGAPRDLPPCDVSAMDGYALPAGAAAGAPLPLRGTSFAGRPAPPLPEGGAMRVMTGAPVPDGASCVLPAECADEADGRVVPRSIPEGGAFIRRRGAECRRGDTLLPAGAPLTPPAVGLLAASGIGAVAVRPRPRVAVLPTGDELLRGGSADHGAVEPFRIDDANGPLLAAFLEREGASARLHPPAPDRAEAVRAALLAAAQCADLVVTTGGVCAGETDFVDEALAELGGGSHRRFRLALKPGKPLSFALVAGCPVVALAGNPVACALAARMVLRPLLRRLLGSAHASPRFLASLAASVRPDRERTELVRAHLLPAHPHPLARPCGKRESNMLSGLAAADCLLHIPPGDAPLAEGTLVPCEPLDW